MWPAESLLAARATLDAQWRERLEREFRVQCAGLKPPKLLIIWNARHASFPAPLGFSCREAYCDALKEHVLSLGQCPYLEIVSSDPRRLVHDTAAAIASMRQPIASGE